VVRHIYMSLGFKRLTGWSLPWRQCVLCEVGNNYFVYCFDELRFTRSELCLRWLVAGISTLGMQVSSQDTMEIGEGPSGTVTVSRPVPQFAPVSIFPAMLHTRSFILLLILSEGQMSKAWEPSKKAMLFQISGEPWTER